VHVAGANIEGDLDCEGGSFKNPGQNALEAGRAKVNGNVYLRSGFNAGGEVSFIGAEIGGDLDCAGGSFKNPERLNVDGAKVGGSALRADRAKIQGDVFLSYGFSADGQVYLIGANIGGRLDLTGADLKGAKLIARYANMKGALIFRDVKADARNDHTEIDLTNASVGALDDDPTNWLDSGRLSLDGFVYDRIGESYPRTVQDSYRGRAARTPSVKDRLCWLRHSMRSMGYRPQPYRQLAKVLGEHGYNAESLDILVGMEDDRRKYVTVPWYRWWYEWPWTRVLRYTIGYGYWPLLAIVWIVFFMIIGFVTFGMDYRAGLLAPSDKDAYKSFDQTGSVPPFYEPFCAAVYSFNTFVPLIDLGQSGRWIPVSSPTHEKPSGHASGNRLTRALCDAEIVDVFPHSLTPSAMFLRFYRWGHTILGWFITTMFVAGVTGLVRR
jgi:hypothetical protein